MKVAFFGYRDWAKQIKHNLEIAGIEFVSASKADVRFYCGWSKMISPRIYKKYPCFVLHPSPLPKYRGGSPLQHQIINGETKSAVTIFMAQDGVDTGRILTQSGFLLKGSLDDIFEMIIKIGTRDAYKILTHYVEPTPQKGKPTYFKRRKPEESEIKEFKSAKKTYNLIRALADPYPNAFIKCKDGKKLYFTGAHL